MASRSRSASWASWCLCSREHCLSGPRSRCGRSVGSTSAWAVLAVVSVVIGGAQVVKLLVPGRQLRIAGVPRRSIVVGLVLAGVGFFVIPVVGFFVGFPLGIYVEERRRLGPHAPAWLSTRKALRAIGLSILIELSATVLAAAVWLATVLI